MNSAIYEPTRDACLNRNSFPSEFDTHACVHRISSQDQKMRTQTSNKPQSLLQVPISPSTRTQYLPSLGVSSQPEQQPTSLPSSICSETSLMPRSSYPKPSSTQHTPLLHQARETSQDRPRNLLPRTETHQHRGSRVVLL